MLSFFLLAYRSVAPTTSVEMEYGTMSKERSFGNVKSCGIRCRSYAPLTWFHIPFLQTWSELRSLYFTKKKTLKHKMIQIIYSTNKFGSYVGRKYFYTASLLIFSYSIVSEVLNVIITSKLFILNKGCTKF